MKMYKISGCAVRMVLQLLLLFVLLFQPSGTNGLAAPADSSQNSPQGTSTALACGCLSATHQVMLLIDDSGSMQANDPKFNRNQVARDLVKGLKGLKDVQVAVIHFNDKVIKSSAWQRVDTTSVAELNDWEAKNIDPDPGFRYTKLGTDFGVALTEAQRLFEQPGLDYCTRRSIVLLSDGTPEDVKGIIKGDNLAATFAALRKLREGITRLDGLYLIGYQVNPRYLGENIQNAWKQLITKPDVFSSRESTGAIGVIRGDHEQGKDLKNLGVSVEVATKYLIQDQQSDIKVAVAVPSVDAKLPLNVSITAHGQNKPLATTQDGNNYQFPWKPATLEDAQFDVKTDLSGATCTGNFALPVVPSNTNTVTNTAGASLVIMPPRGPVDKNAPIILPLRLNYDGEIKSVKWNGPHAQIFPSDGQTATDKDRLTAKVETIAGNVREANLVVDPVGKEAVIEAGVGALITVVSQGKEIEISIPDGTGKVAIGQPPPPPPCTFAQAWTIWFWPLLIGLVGLMILLLVLRAGSRRDTVEDPRANRDIFRIRDWHVLFWPLAALLILLILVPVLGWTCILPPWLFLVSLLFWLVMTGLLRFIPGHNIPRSRAWALLVALLALAFLGFLTISLPVLSWLWLVIALLAILVVVWYISPYEPLVPVPPVQFNLKVGAASELQDGAMLVPLQVNLDGQGGEESSPEWRVKRWQVIATPPGRDLSDEVREGDTRGVGSVAIPRIDKDTRTISVQVSADVEMEDKLIRTPQATATIQVLGESGGVVIPVTDYEQILLNLEIPVPCVSFGETITLRGYLEYKGKDLLPPIWNPSAQILPTGQVIGAKIEDFNKETGEFKLMIGPVIIPAEMYDENNPPTGIQILVCADIDFGDGRTLEVTGKPATIAICTDDLTELEGIGPVLGKLLNRHGIFSFYQLAETEIKKINAWLNSDGYKREDPKTWPQQAKLADISRRYGRQEDRQSYMAYKAWLDRGSEPDERDQEEKDRRETALIWNGIPNFTPVVLSMTLNSTRTLEEAITLPIQLNRDEDPIRLSDVEWQVNARALPGRDHEVIEVKTTMHPVKKDDGSYELVIHPIKDLDASQIQLTIQALKNGRSIEIYYGKAIAVQVDPPTLPPDNLEDLEGIGPVYRKLLNEKKIFAFSQLADTDFKEITKWLNEAGYAREDPKTWPQQAKLAGIAKYGNKEDQRSYEAYKAWLDRGMEPDERVRDEKERRPDVLVWQGTAELTEKAYPQYFKKQ